MFSEVKRQSATRLIQARDYLNYIRAHGSSGLEPEPSYIVGERGLFLVHLYGVVEYTVKSSVSTAINCINNAKCKYIDCKPLFMSIALNGQFDSLAQVGANKKWDKRWDILAWIGSNDTVNLSDDLMPTDGKNFKFKQLESIWKSFCIEEPILPRASTGGILTELVENRNYIAHGNFTPEEIGRRYTYDDLGKKYNAINELCSYIIATFEDYIDKNKYLRTS